MFAEPAGHRQYASLHTLLAVDYDLVVGVMEHSFDHTSDQVDRLPLAVQVPGGKTYWYAGVRAVGISSATFKTK